MIHAQRQAEKIVKSAAKSKSKMWPRIFSCDPNFRGGDPESVWTLYYWGSSPRQNKLAPFRFRLPAKTVLCSLVLPFKLEAHWLRVCFFCIFSVKQTQMDCLICLPDKSGNFLAFRAEIAQNTVKPEKTGFGMAIIARPRPVFCVFGPKISRTFWGKCTEQSSRKKLAEGGFEPEKIRLLYPAPLKKPLLFNKTKVVFLRLQINIGYNTKKCGGSNNSGCFRLRFCFFKAACICCASL